MKMLRSFWRKIDIKNNWPWYLVLLVGVGFVVLPSITLSISAEFLLVVIGLIVILAVMVFTSGGRR